jgi:hypothetical protein
MAPLVLVTIALLAVRLYAAQAIGFGDSESLYASYALFPQPAYLDHPGLVGMVAGWIGGGLAPTSLAAHRVTAVLATIVPWLVYAAARAAGSEKRPAAIAAVAFATTPEIAIGLFAMTPDLLLAIAWVSSLALACKGLGAKPGSLGAAFALFGAGLLAGVGASAKASGALLLIALVATYATRAARTHARTVWPWAGLVAGALVLAPIVLFEARTGWPMATHRFVDTQAGAGPSLRNVLALVGGQLAYVSPLVVALAIVAAIRLVRHRKDDAATTLLFFAFAIPIVPLVAICLWSRVAEPHWIAPALLALPIFAARSLFNRKLVIATIAMSVVFVAIAHAWVLVPSATRLWPTSAPTRAEIANELYGWDKAAAAVREAHAEEEMPGYERGAVVAVGPHWTICAQLQAALERELPIGCATKIKDDWDAWYPRETWARADVLLLVTDDRFPTEATTFSPHHVVTRTRRVSILRGGRLVRTFSIAVLTRRGTG